MGKGFFDCVDLDRDMVIWLVINPLSTSTLLTVLFLFTSATVHEKEFLFFRILA